MPRSKRQRGRGRWRGATSTSRSAGSDFCAAQVLAKLSLAGKDAPAPARAVAGQLHWGDEQNPDLVHVRFILDTEGANANWDYMPRPQLLTSHGSAVFKPIDVEHVIAEDASMVQMAKNQPPVRNTICGVMTHTAACWANSGELLTEKELADLEKTDNWDRPDDQKVAVAAWGALYKFLFPKTVANLLESIDAGQMWVSMERWIGKLDYLVWQDGQYAAT